MSEETLTLYESCSNNFSVEENLTGLLQCISNGHDELRDGAVGSLASGVDTFYLLFAGALVYFMQTGFAMLCAGSIRAKNVKNVILWNLLDSCGGGLAFWAVGYAFAYGGDDDGDKTFIGNKGFFLNDDSIDLESWFFQFAFACALSSIVAGTIAERTQMMAYLFYSAFLAGFCYPVVAHAFWSTNGFLSNTATDPLWGCGAVDLAGSGPVHMTGGVCALVGAIILGPRRGRFHDMDGNPLETPAEFPPHSVALQFLGTFCLWFGWYGFNPGSTLKISSSELGDSASLAAVNTTLAACAGAISAMFTSTLIDWRKTGVATYDLGYTMNGCLTGLVAITAGCATVEPWAGVVIGICAGWFYLLGSNILIRLRIDDAVDAIPVHMVGGAWGVIATGLFSHPDRLKVAFGIEDHMGWFYSWARDDGDGTLLACQLIAVLFVFCWTFVVMGIWYYWLNLVGWFRIDPLEEEVGMDISRYKGSAYDIMNPPAEAVDALNLSRSGHKKRIEGGADATNTEGATNTAAAADEEHRV
jgi:Amt family ammonium transporter